jgi:ferrochelatase
LSPVAYDAILLASFGGPEGQDDVIPFLRNVTRGRGVPEERLEDVAKHYRASGGVSPINRQNRELRAALESELARRGIDLPVLWGNRNWQPYLRDAIVEAGERGLHNLLALGTSAYSSYSSCRQYREDYAAALDETGLADVIQIDKVRQFFDHPGFIEPFIEGVTAALADVAARGIAPGETHVLFTTHSIPTVDAEHSGPRDESFGEGGSYVAQHLAVAGVIMQAISTSALGDLGWSLVYQSRSGPPTQSWLEPDINDAIEHLAGGGIRAVVIVPIGFVSDHMEVVWDLDTEAMATADRLGVVAVRVATPGVHPAFVAGLVDLIVERLEDSPPTERAALTDLGPWFDVCRPGCCENVRTGFKPALAGIAP